MLLTVSFLNGLMESLRTYGSRLATLLAHVETALNHVPLDRLAFGFPLVAASAAPSVMEATRVVQILEPKIAAAAG